MRALVVAASLLIACETHAPAPLSVTVDASPVAAALTPAGRAQGFEALNQNCQMCHSLDLIRSQRLGRAGWEKEVKKMVGWGAPLPPESTASLVAVLSEQFGVDAPATPFEELDPAAVAGQVAPDVEPVAGDARKGAATYAAGCASCHGADGAGGPVGPAVIHRPVLYRAKDFIEVVRTGRQRMPSSPLEEQAVRDMIVFLRSKP